jgi:hypothetical protein
MSAGSDKNKIEIDIAEEWIERMGKIANKICDDSNNNRIKPNGPHTGFIIE